MVQLDIREPSISEALEKHTALIGKPLEVQPRVAVASRALIGRYARAIGSRDPLRLDSSYISGSAWGRAVAYPTGLHCFSDTMVVPAIAGYHRIYGACDWTFKLPVLEGDAISVAARLSNVTQKQGRFAGDMLIEDAEVTYSNQYGDVVAIARPSIIQASRHAAVENGKYHGLAKHHYDGAQLDAIWDVYEREGNEIQGMKPRYWEDVSDAQDVNPIVKGPLVLEDLNSFVGLTAGTPMYTQWSDYMRRHPEDVYWDPETGIPDTWQAGLITDRIANAYGWPAAHDTGTQRVGWLDNLLGNWLGDMGFLTSLSVRLHEPMLVSHTAWCHASVVDKRIVEDQARVSLRLWCVNQDDVTIATGSAEALLPSRRSDIQMPLFSKPKATEPRA